MKVEISDREYQLILEERKRIKQWEELMKKRKSCKHIWRFVASGHKDEMYQCDTCGETKFE